MIEIEITFNLEKMNTKSRFKYWQLGQTLTISSNIKLYAKFLTDRGTGAALAQICWPFAQTCLFPQIY